MRPNNEYMVEMTNRMKSRSTAYALLIICIFDWLYKLLRIILSLNFNIIIDYFSFIINLWKLNSIVITLAAIICLIGIPKFSKFLRPILNTLKQLLKTFTKNPVLIDIPIYVFLLIFFVKFYPYLLKPNERKYHRSNRNTVLKEFLNGLVIYPFSLLISIVLFAFGIYTLISNRLIIKASKRVLSILSKPIQNLYLILTIRIPMPISFSILVFVNILIQLFPIIVVQSYYLLTNRSLILFVIALICLYIIFKWLKPDQKLQVNLTSDIYLNDVSGLNKTRIASIFYPRTVNDIQYLVLKAKSQGKTISIRGQAHTMGGHTLPSTTTTSLNYVCDLKYMNRVEYNETNEEVLVEAGATWTHVIKKLNEYGRSPVVMQSYCTFSVAGSISVNAHGITSDDAICQSVLNIEYIDANGIKQQCNRKTNTELFSLIIGGYGLFGIMTRLTLKTVPNIKVTLEYIRLQSDKFSMYYEKFVNDPTIEIKIARVDLVRPNNILMFIFRHQSTTCGTVADLSDEARVMNPRQHLLYTYVAQHRLFRRIRFALEKMFARPLDLSSSSDRNTTMYESAKPMALLYQPLQIYDDTFLLQEYFVPKQSFQQWYDKLKPIIQQTYSNLFLLNLTIRFVKSDQTTFLSYTQKNDCYAFVFYFRIKRNELGDQQAEEFHKTLIKLTFEYEGTFYLPYRHHYSSQQLSIAYPMIEQFFTKKSIYDPIGLYSNSWYEEYRPKNQTTTTATTHIDKTINEIELITDEFEIVEQRRINSFRYVIRNDLQREKFEKFLRTVFNVEPIHVIFNYINRAITNPENKNDHDIYKHLQNDFKTRQFAFIRNLIAFIKQFIQLKAQIKDMLRQQISIFNKLGYSGKIKDIVTIGDGGRCIKQLRQMLQINDGQVFIINEQKRLTDIIERNSLFQLGQFIQYDFKNLSDVPIPSESIDLVVCYMGLHHLPQQQISIFLKMIYRILRPNGLFLFREHNAYKELIPLLDVAHMIFNVVTGVDYQTEINEIRAFRTIEQWRSCLRQHGFQDTFIYDEQEDDPTDDIMIAFRKPIKQNINIKNDDLNQIIENGSYEKISVIQESNYFRPCEWFIVRICNEFGQYLNHTPFHKFPYIIFVFHYWSLFVIETNLVIQKFGLKSALFASPGFIMNGFIGILLTLAFLQMAFISFLILKFSGQTKPEYEQLIIQQTEQIDNENFNFQELIDDRIDNIQILKEKCCYAIRVPRHHIYTSILKKLALHKANFNLLRISDLDGQIQLELTINNNDQQCLLWLKQYSNINLIFEYKNPIDMKKTHLIVAAKIKYLFTFLRDSKNFENDHSLTIVQIFDHFDWYMPE